MNLKVSASPHIRDRADTPRLMRDVIIALVPALLVSVYMFGYRALLIVSVTVSSAVVFEFASRKIMKRQQTLSDLSAVITGLLLAFSLPPDIPLWMPVIGSFAAIVVAKQLFGGLGQNFVNPALVGRIVLSISYPADLASWSLPAGRPSSVFNLSPVFESDIITRATPLEMLYAGEGQMTVGMPDYLDLFIGRHAGSLGEISIAALLIGVIYLVVRKVISLWTPLAFISIVMIFALFTGHDPIYHLLSGGLILAAFFMATDYTTTPLTRSGKVIFGIGCGLITALIRLFGSQPEGVSYAIVFMNILTQHIERITIPVPFGGGRK